MANVAVSPYRNNQGVANHPVLISSMMTFGFCSQIWVPLFTFPTVQAPHFPHEYPAVVEFEIAMWSILMFGVWYMARWKLCNPDIESVATTAIDRRSDQDESYNDKSESPSISIASTPVGNRAVLTLNSSKSRPVGG